LGFSLVIRALDATILKTKNLMQKLTISLLIFAIILSAITIGMYVYNFTFPSKFALSNNLEDWSFFGSYIGGVLGSLFAFLAFLGVLVTVHLQRRQIIYIENQSHIDEIQRLITNISSTIDDFLSSTPKITPERLKNKEHAFTVFLLISAGGTAALKLSVDTTTQEQYSSTVNDVKGSISNEINCITIEIHQLVWCLKQYVESGGSKVVENYYKNRYQAIVCWIDAMGLINNNERIQNYFKPKEIRVHLNPE